MSRGDVHDRGRRECLSRGERSTDRAIKVTYNASQSSMQGRCSVGLCIVCVNPFMWTT